MNHYQDLPPISRSDAEVALHSASVAIICDALVRITFHDPDWRWVQEKCLKATGHAEPAIRGIAATCLGHLARIHRRLDRAKVLPALENLMSDPKVAGQAEDALDDIETFMGSERTKDSN